MASSSRTRLTVYAIVAVLAPAVLGCLAVYLSVGSAARTSLRDDEHLHAYREALTLMREEILAPLE